MQARTLHFAKREKPESISDGGPITILGYLARLCSKLVSDQILQHWSACWPPEISGGLPGRSARDLCVMQQLQIEQAKTRHTAWGGWTMDLVKAFNLIPRRVVRHIFLRLGIQAHICDFWFLSLTKLTRALQCGRTLGPQKVLRLPQNLHSKARKVLHLPPTLHFHIHKVLHLLRNVLCKVHKVLHLPRNTKNPKKSKT